LTDNDRNIGLSRSLNKGIRLARGTYIARQDADDLSHPDRLRRQVAYLDQHPDVALVGTRVLWVYSDARPLRLSSATLTCAQVRWSYLLQAGGISGATAMFRKREVVNGVGFYDPNFRYANDSEFHSRIARRLRVTCLPEPLYQVRVHDHQMTVTYGDIPRREADRISLQNMLDILKTGDQWHFDWEAHAGDLIALRALYTLAPAHVHKLASGRSRWILLTLLQSFRKAYGLQGKEWDEFRASLSREWLGAANVHLPERPFLAAWLWWSAVRLWWRHALHPSSVRLLLKTAVYPVYKALQARTPHIEAHLHAPQRRKPQ
jgi:glycosyltransferase involved in cell wall biosynthesis